MIIAVYLNCYLTNDDLRNIVETSDANIRLIKFIQITL